MKPRQIPDAAQSAAGDATSDKPELWRLSARRMAAALASGAISPLDAVDAAIARIEAVDAQVNAVPLRDFDRARAQAKRLGEARPERRPAPLAGLPVLIKDMTDVEGLPTTLGDPEVDSAAPISDAVALRLQDRGGVILGKTNVPYLGLGEDTDNPRFGLTVNPWDASRSTAGSSGGAAAALAAGMGWLAHGSDLGGSIRGPASHCGVVGLRPSPGRVGHGGPGTRRMPLDLLNVDGPMARDVGDVGLFLDALAGFTPHDPCATDAAPGVFAAAALTPRLPAEIIALPEMDGVRPAPEVRAVISAALEQLSGAGVAIREHDPARDGLDFAGVADAAYTLRLGAMRARSSPEHLARIAPFLPEIARRTYEDAERLELDAYLAAGERQQGLIRAMGAVLSSGRMLLTPAVSHAPKRHRRADPPPPQPVSPETASHWAREAVFAYAITLSLCPAIVLPAGRTPQGLPVGVQLVGPPRGEAALLSAAKAVEEILALPQVLPIDPRPAGAGPL